MAQRYQLEGALGDHDAGDTGGAQNDALLGVTIAYDGERRLSIGGGKEGSGCFGNINLANQALPDQQDAYING